MTQNNNNNTIMISATEEIMVEIPLSYEET